MSTGRYVGGMGAGRRHAGRGRSGTFLLSNGKLAARCSGAGELLSIENRLAAERYDIARDCFEIETDHGRFTNAGELPIRVRRGIRRLLFQFEFASTKGGRIGVALTYRLGATARVVRRTLALTSSAPLRLESVCLGDTALLGCAEESIHYVTFWMAPTVEFIRFRDGGMFTGIENPFYRADLSENGVRLSYEPGLILAASERYESEPQFFGVYRKSGVMIEDSGRRFRYPNGSGHIPIDRNESRAMREFALDYLAPSQKRFLNINYQFFHPLPQMPDGEADLRYFTKAIDTFADIGGDRVIFNPLHPYAKPDAERDYWNLLPDDPKATARRIADYASRNGISYGFYMGCAAHGSEGNSGGLPFRPDKPEWKKMDADGRRAPDNCLAGDEFYDWWLSVQDNTIKKYRLSCWCWDPSRGSGMNCHDESHGHIAGKGAYKGWRRCMELGRTLKARHRRLFIQAFYGTKQFGLWGLKGVDGHEVYNEQTACVATHHTQISDDRQNADGLRFQNYWSMRFRFLPAVMGHPLVGRMSEGSWDPDLTKACDSYGWQYAFMSALAVSGSIMPSILPYESDLLPGYREFYRKWTAWAKKNFAYVRHTEPFGEQVQPGAVDGYARIRGEGGFIFLFNGNPRSSRIAFEIGDEINLHAEGRYELVELYPSDRGMIILDSNGRSVFAYGEQASITVPANACTLLRLRRARASRRRVLAGINGRPSLHRGRLDIASVSGRPGHAYPVRVRLALPDRVRRVRVNGVEQSFSRIGNEIAVTVGFDGSRFVRELDDWSTPDGSVFAYPIHARQELVELSTTFMLNADIRRLLMLARPKNFAEMGRTIAGWQVSEGVSYSYHNFVCCRPDRLWLVVPFVRANARDIRLSVNSTDCSGALQRDRFGQGLFADITDLAVFGGVNSIRLAVTELGANDFMGPFLLYPDEGLTTEVLDVPPPPRRDAVYSGSLIPSAAPRYLHGARRPVIRRAEVAGNVTLTKSTRLRVSVDLPATSVREVKYTESGFPWMSMGALDYDRDEDCWTVELRPGNRAAIQESEFIYVWAVGIDGLYSDFYPVRVGWDFVP